ncbi:MAG: 2-octaprenylphenol hydroxylase [Candidatus Azotimanducaceae bacterium]|jgi:2-octaprenylphenol hydroxylase
MVNKMNEGELNGAQRDGADIVVVGAGFVGLSFALAAHARGFRVEVYDQKPAPKLKMQESQGDETSAEPALSSSVIALNPTSAALLQSLSVFARLHANHAAPYQAMEVFDGEGTGSVRFTAMDAGLPCMGHIVDQQGLLVALNEQAIDVGLPVHWQTEANFDDDVPLIVGADGAHSQTREKLGLRKVQYSYNQRATVCVVKTSVAHDGCAKQWFQASGPLAALPLSEPNTCALTWSDYTDLATLTDDEFLAQLSESSEDALGQILSLGERRSFPLQQMQALQYVAAGVVLLGDAAHAIHPLAGQGANLGLADVAALIRELSAARLEGRDLGDLKTLRRYERARRSENHMAALLMEGFHRTFTAENGVARLIRGQGMKLVQGNKILKQLAISVASGRV